MDEELTSTSNVATPLWRRSAAASYAVSESQPSAVEQSDPSFDQSVSGEASSQDKVPSGSKKITHGSALLSSITRLQPTPLSIVASNRILNKMELQMASGPKWMFIRRFTLALFFIAVICFVAAAMVIVIQTPECKVIPQLGWWQKGPLYRIALQSFRDTTGNGMGDLRGIQLQLEYIAQLSAVAVIVVPYNNLNQTVNTLNPSRFLGDIFGNIQEMKALLNSAAKYGLKVILDLTLFSAQLESDNSTNTQSDTVELSQNLLTEIRTWFREGVDGIFLKMNSVNLKKEIFIELLKTLKKMAGRYSKSSKQRVFIIATSIEDPDYLISVLMEVPGVMIFVYYLNDLLTSSKTVEKARTLNNYYYEQNFAWSGFTFGEGHIASMIPEEHQGIYVKLFAVLLLTMPGTPVFYYGDEIALKDYKESEYPLMRWDKSKYAGFTNSVPWILPGLSVYTLTVNQQSEDPLSTLSFYRALGKIRTEEQSLQYGDFNIMINTTNILAYIRQWQETGILVILNFGHAVTYDFTALNLSSTALLLAKSTDLTQCKLIRLHTMAIEENMGYVLKYYKGK
ncbi:neutral and basic amino acid transport protein rBAT-like [Hypanus sabinus]|uniref:neutral and basic amino acid transport protein rBAT-like n=1 Tax=Hypanus sabinus TaxID=79690 RepID=UPI0028C39864|nr:neutral and basic amino acid transport protein rBAT-like [Hypanus sabinus]